MAKPVIMELKAITKNRNAIGMKRSVKKKDCKM